MENIELSVNVSNLQMILLLIGKVLRESSDGDSSLQNMSESQIPSFLPLLPPKDNDDDLQTSQDFNNLQQRVQQQIQQQLQQQTQQAINCKC